MYKPAVVCGTQGLSELDVVSEYLAFSTGSAFMNLFRLLKLLLGSQENLNI